MDVEEHHILQGKRGNSVAPQSLIEISNDGSTTHKRVKLSTQSRDPEPISPGAEAEEHSAAARSPSPAPPSSSTKDVATDSSCGLEAVTDVGAALEKIPNGAHHLGQFHVLLGLLRMKRKQFDLAAESFNTALTVTGPRLLNRVQTSQQSRLTPQSESLAMATESTRVKALDGLVCLEARDVTFLPQLTADKKGAQSSKVVSEKRVSIALEMVVRELEVFPKDVRLWRVLSHYLASQGDEETIHAVHTLLTSFLPEEASVWRSLSYIHLSGSVDDGSEAVACLQKCLSLNHRDVFAINNYGVALIKSDRYREALDVLALGVTLDSGSEWMWCNLGVAQHCCGLWEESALSFRHAIAIANDKDMQRVSKDKASGSTPPRAVRPAQDRAFASRFNLASIMLDLALLVPDVERRRVYEAADAALTSAIKEGGHSKQETAKL